MQTRTYVTVIIEGQEPEVFPAAIVEKSVLIEITERDDNGTRGRGQYRLIVVDGSLDVERIA